VIPNGVVSRASPRLLQAAASDTQVEARRFVPDVRQWVARASVFIVPLRPGVGTRLKMVDAMAQGKAIVATQIGAEAICGDYGRGFVLADEPRQFADAMIRLLKDREARRELGDAARPRVEAKYGWLLFASGPAESYADAAEEHHDDPTRRRA